MTIPHPFYLTLPTLFSFHSLSSLLKLANHHPAHAKLLSAAYVKNRPTIYGAVRAAGIDLTWSNGVERGEFLVFGELTPDWILRAHLFGLTRSLDWRLTSKTSVCICTLHLCSNLRVKISPALILMLLNGVTLFSCIFVASFSERSFLL